MSKSGILKLEFWVYMHNNQDGSASPMFFASEDLAEKTAKKTDERFCDDIVFHEFKIDLETGKVISGIETDDIDEEGL